jgi:two-component sensor histidine kinase
LRRFGLAAVLFLLAFGISSFLTTVHVHYPYLAYFLAAVAASYFAGIGPGALTTILSGVTVYLTFAPTGFVIDATQSAGPAAATFVLLLLGCNWGLGSLKASRDRLAAERERFARLAEQRELLYRELQHRVSNNIAVVAALLHLESRAVDDPAARRALGEAASRIDLIARIQRHLHGAEGEAVPFRRFAEDLLSDAVSAAGGRTVRVEIHGGEAALPADQAIAVCLVLLECVNNALEHAFAANRGGVVRVALTREGDHMDLTVRDDGLGPPEGFDLERSRSLGLKIVRTMAAQLGGDFSLTRADPGALCRLRFPAAANA